MRSGNRSGCEKLYDKETDIIKKIRLNISIIAACFLALVFSACSANDPPATLLIDGRILAKTKQRLRQGDPALKPAFDKLLSDAEAAMQEGPFAVTDKKRLPASGDRHDYASYARYWWPDPSQPDGMPYIKRDGKTNPESLDSASTDRYRMDRMVIAVEKLGLAYYLTDESRYAGKAAQLLRTWFINPETRMNPNLNHAQYIPGDVPMEKAGVIDSRVLCRALDGALLIKNSSALTADEITALRTWCGDYLNWLKTDPMAILSSESLNNRGTFFDVQAMYYALFAGDTASAREIAEAAVQKRVLSQIKPDGSMPEELARTRSLHYSIFGLQAMMQLARLAEQVDVDLWQVGDNRIRAALDYVAPYADPSREWPIEDIGKEDSRLNLLWPLLYAADFYKDEHYLRQAERLPEAERIVHRANLATPLM